MRRAAAALLGVGAVALAGCSPQHLPGRAHWYGSAIWVPKGDVEATALAVCQRETLEVYGRDGFIAEHHVLHWRATKAPDGGELLDCLTGVQEQFTR